MFNSEAKSLSSAVRKLQERVTASEDRTPQLLPMLPSRNTASLLPAQPGEVVVGDLRWQADHGPRSDNLSTRRPTAPHSSGAYPETPNRVDHNDGYTVVPSTSSTPTPAPEATSNGLLGPRTPSPNRAISSANSITINVQRHEHDLARFRRSRAYVDTCVLEGDTPVFCQAKAEAMLEFVQLTESRMVVPYTAHQERGSDNRQQLRAWMRGLEEAGERLEIVSIWRYGAFPQQTVVEDVEDGAALRVDMDMTKDTLLLYEVKLAEASEEAVFLVSDDVIARLRFNTLYAQVFPHAL
ncbi:hypothetical protein IAT38_007407 [Cryptococcus sp. DSM 104549]